MKKTSIIILTLVASLSISLGSAQTTQPPNPYPPDDLYEPQGNRRDTVRYDTLRPDSTGNYYYQQNNVYYNYYFRNRFYNGLYRTLFPRSYYARINRPGFVPRHLRSGRTDLANGVAGKHPIRGSSSGRRGGFGHSGVTHSQFN